MTAWDALVCALMARAVHGGQTLVPETDEQQGLAEVEGWIHLPAHALADGPSRVASLRSYLWILRMSSGATLDRVSREWSYLSTPPVEELQAPLSRKVWLDSGDARWARTSPSA